MAESALDDLAARREGGWEQWEQWEQWEHWEQTGKHGRISEPSRREAVEEP